MAISAATDRRATFGPAKRAHTSFGHGSRRLQPRGGLLFRDLQGKFYKGHRTASLPCDDSRVSNLPPEPPESSEQPEGAQIYLPPEMLAGVWANMAQVSHTLHEFTLDFVRLDGTAPPPGRGIVVARVSVSPLFITQLIDALNDNWQKYAEKALPKEVNDDDDA